MFYVLVIFFKNYGFIKLENDLVSEIKLSPIQAKIYLLITWYGKMSSVQIANKLKFHLKLLKNCY